MVFRIVVRQTQTGHEEAAVACPLFLLQADGPLPAELWIKIIEYAMAVDSELDIRSVPFNGLEGRMAAEEPTPPLTYAGLPPLQQ
jgi:hypothetical protein